MSKQKTLEQTHLPYAIAEKPPADEGRLRKVARLLQEEWYNFHPRLLIAGALLAVLPRGAFGRLRASAYRRLLGLQIGRGTTFSGPLRLRGMGDFYQRLSIGENASMGEVFISLNAEVAIGDRVSIGDGCVLTTDTHQIGPATRRLGQHVSRPIRIEEGCWIDNRTIVHPGVTIGRGSVVAGDSVVTHDVPANSLVAGIPARFICTLAEAATAATWLEMLAAHV